MKKLAKLIKNTDTKQLIGLGVAVAIGTATGVKAVAKKRKKELAQSTHAKKASELINTTLETGGAVVNNLLEVKKTVITGICEDISTVVESAKAQTKRRCSHCPTDKNCCKIGETCTCKIENLLDEGKKAGFNATVAAQSADQLPEALKAADVVAKHEEADTFAESLKNSVEEEEDITVGEIRDAETTVPTPPEVKKPVARKPRAKKVTPKPEEETKEN